MKKIIYSITALLALCIAGGCKKYVDINQNPNAPVIVDASSILPPMLAGMERGVWFDSRYVSQYSQMWGASTANNVWDQEGYLSGNDAGGEIWRTVYFSFGQNVGIMWADAIPNKKYDYVGVGWALRAWGWQTGGDMYNNMIVKEAFDPTKLTFDYDSPDYVYAEVVKDCQQALNYLNTAIKTDGLIVSPILAKGDYMYNGDRSKWIKFVYGILAQNAVHLSNKTGFNPDLVKKYVDSSFVSNADNATIQNTGSISGDSNFWGPTRGNLGTFRQSDYIVKLMDGRILTGSSIPNNLLDPRLPLVLNPSKDGVYRGEIAPFGDPNIADANTNIPAFVGATTATSSTSAAKYIFNDNSRGVIMTYPETQFFAAEAMYKKGDINTAYAYYKAGILGSLQFVSNPPLAGAIVGSTNYISPAAMNAYMASAAVKQSPATLLLSDIMQQKFIALYLYGPLEAWVDERKYAYNTTIFQGFTKPATLFTDNQGKQVYVMRPRYNSEYIWNVPALQAIGALAPDYHTTKPYFVLP